MKGRTGGRFGGARIVHAIDPDEYENTPRRQTMCRKSISRRYTTSNSSGPVNCEACKVAVGRAIEADTYDSTVGEMFDWSALLLPRGRRTP